MAIELRITHAYPKLYFKRDLVDYRSPHIDPFDYRSINDTAIPDEVFRVIATTAHDTAVLDLTQRGKNEFDYLMRWAERAFDPNYWWLAYLGGNAAGFVFPQLYWDAPGLGSVWHIGVLDEFRGKGYGKILHARALETLRVLGATKYSGSTEPYNIPMIQVFRANGCTCTGMRIIEEFGSGDDRNGRAL